MDLGPHCRLLTTIDILDVLDWKVWITAAFGVVVSSGISTLLGAPGWAIFGFGLAGACIGLGLLIVWQEWQRGRPKQDTRSEIGYKRCLLGGDGIPSGHTRLPEAARMFYEASKAGKLPTIYAHASEKLSGLTDNNTFVSGSPENILEWWAGYLSKRLPIYGTRPPSTKHKEIPERDVNKFSFSEGAEKLKDPTNDNVFYTNLTVETALLRGRYDMESAYNED